MATYTTSEKLNIDGSAVERVESEKSTASEELNNARIDRFTEAERKKIVWRIDRRLVILLGFMYCVSLMDRTNMGIAAIAGMSFDLNLIIENRYQITVLVFFLTYVVLQPPATIVLRKVGPRVFLPAITIAWGIVMMCFGFVRDWTQLTALRLLLGVFEAGFFPGCAYLLSCWYTRFELQKRNAVFYLIGSMASAFAGILAFGLDQMNGLGNLGPTYSKKTPPGPGRPNVTVGTGIAGWRWIFIMEGILTIIVGVIGVFLICDFPEKQAKGRSGFAIPFLNEDEANFIVAKIENDRKDAIPEPFRLGSYMKHALDIKIWGFAALFGLTTTVSYAIAYFLPIILQGMGFSTGAAQCLIAPPYVLAAIVMYGCAYFGDKYHLRGPFIIANALYGIVGLALLGFVSNVGVRYFGAFLATASANANVPAVLTFQANNIRGQWKRALASATLVGTGGIGGIIGSTVFRTQDAPTYRPGMYTCMIASALVVIICSAMDLSFHRANRRAAAGGRIIEGLEGFRYTL